MSGHKSLTKSIFYTPKEVLGKPWTYTDETRSILEREEKGTVTRPKMGQPLTLKEKPFKPQGPRCRGLYDAKVGSQRNLPPVHSKPEKQKRKHWLPFLKLNINEVEITVRGRRSRKISLSNRLKERFKPC